jgi:tRNA G46 methylase TrmB
MIPEAKVDIGRRMAVNPLKMQEMLEQARHMQDQMQEKLSQTVVEASSGGGAVTVKMSKLQPSRRRNVGRPADGSV